MRVKKRSAKKLQFSNRSQGKKSQERNCDSPIRVKKISVAPIRIELEILAIKMTPHNKIRNERDTERETDTEREAKQARERASSKTWKAKHTPSAIPSLSQSKEEEESVCWEKSVRY